MLIEPFAIEWPTDTSLAEETIVTDSDGQPFVLYFGEAIRYEDLYVISMAGELSMDQASQTVQATNEAWYEQLSYRTGMSATSALLRAALRRVTLEANVYKTTTTTTNSVLLVFPTGCLEKGCYELETDLRFEVIKLERAFGTLG